MVDEVVVAHNRVDAVVVAHNSAEDLEEQLACADLREAFGRIVVVDNASDDGSVTVARRAGTRVLERGINDSLSAAINDGVRATASELVAILNPDVLIDDPTLVSDLAETFEDPAVGVNAPALRLPDGSLQDSARRVPTPLELVRRRLGGSDIGAVRPSEPFDVDWVVAAFTLVRREAFEQVGGFDPRYRLYFEDVDFCVRMWRAGWRVRIDPRWTARHEHKAASRQALTSSATRRHMRSALRFYTSHPTMAIGGGHERLAREMRGAA